MPDSRRLPLEGIVVIDLTHIYNGPYATFLMAMAGATVIKIEPRGGEHLRHRAELGGAAVPFAMLNANKQAVTLNLKSVGGVSILQDMIRKADVLVENFAPGALQRLGITPASLQALNPRLIYASSTGYGQSGPYRDYPAMDLTIQAMCGVMATTGFAENMPVKAGPAVADFFGGVHLYGAITTALFERERTGIGSTVEVSMQEAVYASLSSSIGMFFANQQRPTKRTGNRHSGLAEAPYNVYPTADGYIAIIGNNDRHFTTVLGLMGREDLLDDPRFAGLKARADNMQVIDDLIGGWTVNFDKQALADLLLAHRVPCSPVRDVAEVVNDPHMHARGALEWIDHPRFGRIVVQRSPMRYEGTPTVTLTSSRELGQDNHSVYGRWLGISEAEIARLANEQII
jgi:formyl-CoA transferase